MGLQSPLGLLGHGIFAWVVWAGLANMSENLGFLELELLVKRERTGALVGKDLTSPGTSQV